jgi:hypothetical protein
MLDTMHDRTLLGPADVTGEHLARMVADLLGHDPGSVRLLESRATEVAYDLPAITTAGRYWVSGSASTPDGEQPFRIFVKHVQCWSRSPFFVHVPEAYRDFAADSVPWRTEPLAYASDLGDRLPEGLSMPRALDVVDLDEKSAAIWVEEVTHPAVPWDLERYQRAAYLLGRLAASPRIAELANVGNMEWSVRTYLVGRLGMQVLPILRSDDIWRHPAISAAFGDELRDRLRAAADRVDEYADELDGYPLLTAHGDASPNNLLPGPTPDSFVLIDFGFWLPATVGHDLGQLLVGDVQLGRRSPALLAETEDVIVPAYAAGLADEGLVIDEAVVRRSHALRLLIFTGLSALPFDELASTPPVAMSALAADRAELARFCLDLVDATEIDRVS